MVSMAGAARLCSQSMGAWRRSPASTPARHRPWPRREPSSAAPSAAARRPSGRASARTAARGTRWSRRSPRPRATRFESVTGARSAVTSLATVRRARERAHPHRASRSSTACWAADSSPGGVVLLGGDPGIGKSTLLLQACAALGARTPHALRDRRGIGGAGRAAGAAPRARQRARRAAGRGAARGDRRAPSRATQPEVVVIDSIQTVYTEALHVGAGQRCAGPRVRGAADAARQAARHRRHPRRPRDQGRRDRRPPRARAHRRHRAVFRGRPAFELPPGARDQEPLRRGQRARRFRA